MVTLPPESSASIRKRISTGPACSVSLVAVVMALLLGRENSVK